MAGAVVLLSRSRLSVVGEVLTYRSRLRNRSWRHDQIAEFRVVQSPWQAQVGYLCIRTLDGEQIAFHVASWTRRRPERLSPRTAGAIHIRLISAAGPGWNFTAPHPTGSP